MYSQINEIKSYLTKEDINIVINYFTFKKDIEKELRNNIKLLIVTILSIVFLYVIFYLFGINNNYIFIFTIIFFIFGYTYEIVNGYLLYLPKRKKELTNLCERLKIKRIKYEIKDIEKILKEINKRKSSPLKSEEKHLLAILYMLIFDYKTDYSKGKTIDNKHLLKLECEITRLMKPSLFLLEDITSIIKN